jgi:hypothetical protein
MENNNKSISDTLQVFGNKSKPADDIKGMLLKALMSLALPVPPPISPAAQQKKLTAHTKNIFSEISDTEEEILSGSGPSEYGVPMWQGIGKPKQSFKQDPSQADVTDIAMLVQLLSQSKPRE